MKENIEITNFWKSYFITGSHIPQRWVTVIIGCFGSLSISSMRISLSIVITEIVLPSNNTIEFLDDTCSNKNNNSTQYKSEMISSNKLYDWSGHTQGLILSSFYWGYLLTNLSGGVIAEKYSSKHTLGLGILSTSLLTILAPSFIVWGGPMALICLCAMKGLCEGATYPALSVLLAQWIPEDERSKAVSATFSGAALGTIFGMTVSGLILRYSATGWPAVFYFFGSVGVLDFVLTSAFCYSKPSKSPFISEDEANYLKDKLKYTHENLPPTPWRHILTSVPVWAMIIATIGNAWGFSTISSSMPKYMSNVLEFSTQDNGYFMSLPYVCMWLMSFFASWLADHAIAKGYASIGTVRKIGNTIASLGPGVFIIAVSYAGCDRFLVVVMLTVAMTFMAFSTCSVLINPLDLGPNYAGILMGLTNGVTTMSSIVSPYMVGLITPNNTISKWRLVFWIIFTVFTVTNFIFLIFGSGELQEWNDPKFIEKEKQFSKKAIKETCD